MKKKDFNINYLIFILIFSLPMLCIGQEKTITGTVVSAEDNMPLLGATIVVKGTTNGTSTDFDGNYSINANTGDILVFSYVGYTTREITIASEAVINISLTENASVLDEIVVTGYSSQSRTTLATSVSKLDETVLESASLSNAGTALQGTVAGLVVTQTTGQPGSSPSITLRGGTDFDGTGTPLILIDGVPGSFYALNADDIESIETLKDAASTAIYGARAANGVILVTTKKGKSGRTNITYKQKYSFNEQRSDGMNYLGAADYIVYNRRAIENFRMVTGNTIFNTIFANGAQGMGTGNNTTDSNFTTMFLTPENNYLLQQGWQQVTDPITGDPIIFQESDSSKLFYQNSTAEDHYLSFDGGNEKGNFYLGMGFLDNKGLILNSGFKRYSGKFSGSYNIKDNLKVNSNVLYSHSNLNRTYLSRLDWIVQRAGGAPPTTRLYNHNPDGTLSDELHPGTNVSFGNPLYYHDKFVRRNLEQRLTLSAGIDWEIIPDLTLSARGSILTINNVDEAFNKAYRDGAGTNTARNASASLERTVQQQYTALLNYKKTIAEKHNFDALLGAEYFNNDEFFFSGATTGSPTDLISTLNAGSEPTSASSFGTEYALSSALGQLLYDFDAKYLVGLFFRYDGASRLGDDKFEFFPGVSLGWNVDKEAFFKDSFVSKAFSRLKPRFSYGQSGNIEVLSNFGVFGSYGDTGVYNGVTGYANNGLPTLGLRWEKSTTANYGLDVSLLNGRVNIIADYFVRDVKDKLSTLIIPAYTGFTGILTNNGTLRNKGFELQLNADIINTENLRWNFGTTFSKIKSFVQKLPENDNDLNRQGGTEIDDPNKDGMETIFVGGLQEGERVGLDVVVAFEQESIYANQAEVDADADRVDVFLFNQTQRFPGDVRWKDLNGDDRIDALDRKVIGRTTPDFVGGFTSSLDYKGFNLFVKTDFAIGHLIKSDLRERGLSQVQGNQNGGIEILDTWSPTNTNASIARFDFTDPQRNHRRGVSRLWEKGDYLALREVTLSYNFPTKWFNNKISAFRIYATGTNLHYFKKYFGNAPEHIPGQNGIDSGRFPLPKTYTLGLNITL